MATFATVPRGVEVAPDRSCWPIDARRWLERQFAQVTLTMMMALTALLAASASATPQTRPAMLAKSLSLRGGSLDTPEGKFFAFSGTVASANGERAASA